MPYQRECASHDRQVVALDAGVFEKFLTENVRHRDDDGHDAHHHHAFDDDHSYAPRQGVYDAVFCLFFFCFFCFFCFFINIYIEGKRT